MCKATAGSIPVEGHLNRIITMNTNPPKLYTASMFPRRRCYAVIAQNKKTGKIFGCVDDSNTMISDKRICAYFNYLPEFPPVHSRGNFSKVDLERYRIYHGGHNSAARLLARVLETPNSNQYNISLVRINSTKCPIKLTNSKHIKGSQTRIRFFTVK